MSESKDISGFIFQPEHGENSLESIELFTEQNLINTGGKSHIIIKETLEIITPKKFKNLSALSENVIFLVRDPQSQFLSAARALDGKGSGKKSSTEDNEELLRNGRFKNYLHEYSELPWSRVKDYYDQITVKNPCKNIVVADGDLIRTFPEWGLKGLCKKIGIQYSENMTNDWSKVSEKGVKTTEFDPKYVHRAMVTNEMKKPIQDTPSLDLFSKSNRAMAEKCLRIYTDMISSEHMLLPTPQAFAAMLKQPINGNKGISDVCPVMCYAVAARLAEDAPHASIRNMKKIREKNQAHSASFDIIENAIISENMAVRYRDFAAGAGRGAGGR